MRKLYLFFAVLCSLLGAQTASAATTFNGGWTAYLVPGVWNTDGAKFAVYVHNNEAGPQWVEMTDTDGDGYYSATVPTGVWTNIIFVRMNSTCTISSITDKTTFWNNKWNQTTDMGDPLGNNCCTITGWNESDYKMSNYTPAVTITDVYLYKSGGTTEEFALSNGKYILDEVTISTSDNYYINVKYSDNTTKAFMPNGVSGSSVASGTTYNMVDRGSSEYFTFSSFNYSTVSAVLTVSNDAPATVTFTEISNTYPKVALVGEDGGSVIAYFTQDETDTWLWKLGPQSITAAADDNPTSSKYRFRVYTSKTSYIDYNVSAAPNDENYWINGGTVYYLAAGSGNFCVRSLTTGYFAVTMLNNALTSGIVASSDLSSQLSKPVEPVKLPTKEWSVTATTTEPAVFLMSQYMNNERVTPEYQLTKNSDGKYELKNFVMIPNATFYFRVFTSSTSYTDYKSNGSSDWAFRDGDGIVDKTDLTAITATANNALSTSGSKPFVWQLGFTMTDLTVDFSKDVVLFNLIIDEDNPSTWVSAPDGFQGMPYVGLVGTSTTQSQSFVNPNYDVNSVFTTDRAWQDGYVQYDADGNVMVYASGVNSEIYGEGAAAGRAMYNTIWPPRNTISFNYNGFESSSNDMRLNYVGVKKRKDAKTSNDDANSDEKDYAVYEINSIEMFGAYKVWSGWGGQHAEQNKVQEAYWSTHNNWGYGTWVKDSGTEINVNTWYNLSGAGQFANGTLDTDAGGDFYFAGKKYFSKVEFWYSLDSDADIQNSGLTLSYVIAYLADGDPKILATRTGKNQITATYDIINPPTDSRNISKWWVDLYKDGELYMEKIQSATGSFDPAEVEGSFTTDGLTAGLYQYKMYAIYEGLGDIASTQVGPALSPEIRIFQATIPNNTNVEQLVYTDAAGTTEATADDKTKYWSFDLRLTAEAPKTLTETELELAEAYVIGVPKGTSYTSVTVEDNATLTPISSKDDLAGNVYSEDLVNYDFDKSSYFMVEPKTDDYAMPTIIFHDVVPGDYTFYVSMCCSDGDEEDWEEYQVSSASAMVNMYKPTTSYSVENFAIVTAGETAAKATDETNQPLGTSEAQPVSFHSFNKLQTVGGKIGQLMVTNSVLSAWNVTYGLTAAVDETSIDNINLQYDNASLNSAAGVTANFDYLPVAYTSATRGLSTGIDEIDSKEFRWIDAEDFKYGMTVKYTRTSDNVSVDAEASTGTVMINPVDGGNVTNYDQLKAYQGTTEDNNDALKKFTVHNQSAWSSKTSDGEVIYFLDAYKAINLINSTTLNKGVGYYSSNGHSCNITYYKATTNAGYQPIVAVEGGEVIPGAGYEAPFNALLGKYAQEDAEANFSEVAASEGILPIKIGHIGKGKEGVASVDDLPDFNTVYTVLTAEYPFLVKPALVSSVSEASDEDAEDLLASYSMVTLAYPSTVYAKRSDTTTDINDIAADVAGDFRIWPNPAVDVVNVAASAALGTIEIYAVDGRLVKTVEVDDTHAALEVSDLVKGTYIIRAAGASQRMIKK